MKDQSKNITFSLLIFIFIPLIYIFVKTILLMHNITNLIIIYVFLFIFYHLFYSLLEQKYKIYSFFLSCLTIILYLLFSFSTILINYSYFISNLNIITILQHFIVSFISFFFYNILNNSF
jgi:hypothetical protein